MDGLRGTGIWCPSLGKMIQSHGHAHCCTAFHLRFGKEVSSRKTVTAVSPISSIHPYFSIRGICVQTAFLALRRLQEFLPAPQGQAPNLQSSSLNLLP